MIDLVYLNGDSHSSPQKFKIYGEYISEHYGSKFINHSMEKSSNNRIFRSSLRDLLTLQHQYKNILACVSLSYVMRTDIWDTNHTCDHWRTTANNDGDFLSIQPFSGKDWSLKSLFNNEPKKYKDFCKSYAVWYNVEAETTKLLEKIILFSNWCENNNIKYLIFSPMYQEPIDFLAPFVCDFYKNIQDNKSIINPFEFSFLEWCVERGHEPIDNFTAHIHGKTFQIGHQGESGHKAFAEFLLENHLKTY
jgi:hypothetical protein